MNMQRLKNDLRFLSYVYPIAVDDDYESILVKNFNMPPGYNHSGIEILLELPSNYPESPPGVGDARLYVPSNLKYHGRTPSDFHTNCGPTTDWAWWCYERIDWNPCKDNLITFFELLRAHMTNPK